jgi:hypothetical protein
MTFIPETYLMTFILETRRAHYIWYLRLYFLSKKIVDYRNDNDILQTTFHAHMCLTGAVKILPAKFSLPEHEFVWI